MQPRLDAATDAELVALCRVGDDRAWTELVDRYARYVHAIASRVYRLPHTDAEDVFQEVFARIYERLDSLRDDDALRPWIAQTARRCSVDALRRSGRELSVAAPPEGVDESLARLDEALAVRAALEDLSPECREVLDRFFYRDESYLTIGVELELPAGTIASRISRCLVRLKDRLEPGRKLGARASGGKMDDNR